MLGIYSVMFVIRSTWQQSIVFWFRSPYLSCGLCLSFIFPLSVLAFRMAAFGAVYHLEFNVRVSCHSIMNRGDDGCDAATDITFASENRTMNGDQFIHHSLFHLIHSSWRGTSSRLVRACTAIGIWHSVRNGTRVGRISTRLHSRLHLYLAPQKCIVTPRRPIGNMNEIVWRRSQCKFCERAR